MKHLAIASLLLASQAQAANLNWYCESYCNFEVYTTGGCSSRYTVIETEGTTPVQTITQLRMICEGKHDQKSCPTYESKLTTVDKDGTNLNKPATIENSCHQY